MHVVMVEGGNVLNQNILRKYMLASVKIGHMLLERTVKV